MHKQLNDAPPWPFNLTAVRLWVDKHYPELSERERDTVARAILAWFYGEFEA